MSSSRPMEDGKHHDKPFHKFSSNGTSASATAGSTTSSTANSAAAASVASHSHAMRAYVTEPVSAGNRNAALHGSQPRTEAEVINESEIRMQIQLDEYMRNLSQQQ